MTVKDYSGALALAHRLIDKFGRPLRFRRVSREQDSPVKPWDGPPCDEELRIEAELELTGAFADNRSLRAFFPEGSDFLARMGQVALCAPPATGEDLGAFDEVFDGTAVWRIAEVELFRPGPVALLYFVRLQQ